VSISQLTVYNSVKHTRTGTKRDIKTRHSVSQETPLPLYLAMMLHAENRTREPIDKRFSFGLCVSYDCLLQISASAANTAGYLYDLNCGRPFQLYEEVVFMTATADNIDHNPSSTTVSESFHGTGISFTQHRVFETDGQIITDDSIVSTSTCHTKAINPLPFTYTHVPLVQSLHKDILAPVVDFSRAVSDDLAAKRITSG